MIEQNNSGGLSGTDAQNPNLGGVNKGEFTAEELLKELQSVTYYGEVYAEDGSKQLVVMSHNFHIRLKLAAKNPLVGGAKDYQTPPRQLKYVGYNSAGEIANLPNQKAELNRVEGDSNE